MLIKPFNLYSIQESPEGPRLMVHRVKAKDGLGCYIVPVNGGEQAYFIHERNVGESHFRSADAAINHYKSLCKNRLKVIDAERNKILNNLKIVHAPLDPIKCE